MKKKIFTLFALAFTTMIFAQDKPGVGIGGKRINKAAILDIQANNKGVLFPRIALDSTTVLNGGVNPEGVIVYSTGAGNLASGFYYWTGTAWEKVSDQSEVLEQITNLEQTLETKIENITNIIGDGGSGSTDISYLVSYNPDNHTFKYLKPNATGGYDPVEINFTSAVGENETNTFLREITKTITENGVSETVVEAYIYFSEQAIKTWKQANPTGDPVTGMLNTDGTKIDVLGVVNNNIKEIFENTNNTEIINEIIMKAPNNVWIEDRGAAGKFLVYRDENDALQEVDLNQQETQTEIFRNIVEADGQLGRVEATELLEASDLKKGDIYYSYHAEHGKTYYINMTNDVVNSVINNEILQNEIFNVVNNYTSEGGNVFYGSITGVGGDDVLYIVDAAGDSQQIDISKDIIKILEQTTNNVLVETILKQIEVQVVDLQHDVAVGTSIDGAKVYKGKREISVNHIDGYDVTFTGVVRLDPTVKVVDGTTTTHESTNEKAESLLSVSILDKSTKQLVTNAVTDVTINANNELTFSFGSSIMYTTLNNGMYEVILEYTAK